MERIAERIPDPRGAWDAVTVLDDEAEMVSKLVLTKKRPAAVAETVLYRYPTYADRTVVCCSVQSGCPVGCTFCGTGDAFVRNLTVEEIVAQPVAALALAEAREGTRPQDVERLQIMFMSMGEPMLNMARLIGAIEELHGLYPGAALLVSTSAPDVDYEPFFELSRRIERVGLQFSVHESTDAARDLLIPFGRKLGLARIAETGEAWARAARRRPFFNYCVHAGNASDRDVANLVELFDPALWEATVSVICERNETLAAAHDRQLNVVEDFMSRLLAAGYSTRKFDPAGQDTIGGGCGQLFHTQRWFAEHPDEVRANRRR